MPSTIRTKDDSEYRIHFEVFSGPEWTITGIDYDPWSGFASYWIAIELAPFRDQKDALYSWAESLDLSEECAEYLEGQAEADAELRYDLRRER